VAGPSKVEAATWEAVGHLLFAHAPAGVALVDLQGRFLAVNAALEAMLGRSAGELQATTLTAVSHPDDVDDEVPVPAELLEGDLESARSVRRVVRPDGSVVAAELVVAAVRDEYGSVRRLVVQVAGIRELAVAADRPGPDPLTGLASRSTMSALLGHALRLPPSMGVLAVVHVDVSALLIADGDGGPTRDQLLPAAASRLLEAVGSDGVVGRCGADAFLVVLDEAASSAEVDDLAARLRAVLEGLGVALGAARARVLVGVDLPSRGVAADPGPAAEAAIERARSAGRGNGSDRSGASDGPVDLAAPVAAGAADRPDRAGDDLESALDPGALGGVVTAWFQPVVELATGSVVGHEALARWRHPQRGVLRPAQFMPAAELHGLTARVDDAVLDHACRHLSASGGGDGDVFVSVNLSLDSVLRSGLADRVRLPLALYGVDPSRLVLELTEAVVLQLTPAARRDLKALDGDGVRVFLDDFGAGYGALAVFDDLPVRGVKLDRGLVEASERDDVPARMLDAMRRMVDALGVDGVVEGVETTEEAERLLAMGWRHAQGYLFGSPQPLAPA
jgi:PAS domain S-box-containing protein